MSQDHRHPVSKRKLAQLFSDQRPPIALQRCAIAKLAQLFSKLAQLLSVLRPLIALQRCAIAKLAQLFSKLAQLLSVLRPLIALQRCAIAKLAQLLGNFTPQLSSRSGYGNSFALLLPISPRHLTEVWPKPPVSTVAIVDTSRRLPTRSILPDIRAYAGLAAVQDYTACRPEAIPEVLQANLAAMQAQQQNETELAALAKAAADEARQAEWECHNSAMAMKESVRGLFGPDS